MTAARDLGRIRQQPIVHIQGADIERGQVDWVDVALDRWIPAILLRVQWLATGLIILTIIVQVGKHLGR